MGWWSAMGLPEIHYTVMSSILMFIAIGLHVGLSAMTRTEVKEGVDKLVWSRGEAKEIFTTLERPIWLDRTLLSGLLIVCMCAMIVWFW